LIQEVILALREEADALGLAGTGAAPVAAG
jgi:hypothetical protein